VYNLRILGTAELTFADTYDSGFSDGLNRLGPAAASTQADVNHVDLLDPVRAGLAPGGTNSSFERSGYRFTYTPGPRDAKGAINSYTIIARPIKYGKVYAEGKMVRSFFTDQSGIIRFTSEERPATATDPVLQ